MNFKIDYKEVLRYLKSDKNLKNKNITRLIEEARKELNEIITFRYIYQKFPIELTKSGIKLRGSNLLLEGKSIYHHLKISKKVYLMAATLGFKVDKRVSLYEKISLTKSVIFDACASVAIEEGCDCVEDKIKKETITAGNKDITSRFSPGYGDLSIDIQKKFLEVLKAQKKIGLTASKYNMLLPAKSVTAIIGVIDNENRNDEKNSCQSCGLKQDCDLRRKGIYCGFKR